MQSFSTNVKHTHTEKKIEILFHNNYHLYIYKYIMIAYIQRLFNFSISDKTKTSQRGLFTPPRNRGGVIFSLQFVSVCVCVSVCVSNFSCEQSSSRTDAPILKRFSLNVCLAHWLRSYWNWWPWVKGQGHSGSISICSS